MTKRESKGALFVYAITYLCRVETEQVELYDARGHMMKTCIRKTKLIERDCFVQHESIELAAQEIADMDVCFVRILTVNVIQPRTVVHILDRATNYQDKV